jgi:hypothetical protein
MQSKITVTSRSVVISKSQRTIARDSPAISDVTSHKVKGGAFCLKRSLEELKDQNRDYDIQKV